MKLIIWWIALMFILPLLYLFWWKKAWRLQLGVAILLVLAIGIFAPSEIVHSMLKNKLDKEVDKPKKELEKALNNISDTKPNAADNEKLQLEKEIKNWQGLLDRVIGKIKKNETINKKELNIIKSFNNYLSMLRQKWIKKFGGETNSLTFLFCGEEFNQELARGTWGIESSNIIDFGKQKDVDSLKKKLQKIHEENHVFPCLVWLKNVDKINDSSLKNEFLKIVDSDKNTDLGKYQQEVKLKGGETWLVEKTIDFSRFILFATTLDSNPQLSSEIKHKLKNAYPNLLKYNWIAFFISGGLEVVVFLLLIRAKKKNNLKLFKQSKH